MGSCVTYFIFTYLPFKDGGGLFLINLQHHFIQLSGSAYLPVPVPVLTCLNQFKNLVNSLFIDSRDK